MQYPLSGQPTFIGSAAYFLSWGKRYLTEFEREIIIEARSHEATIKNLPDF